MTNTFNGFAPNESRSHTRRPRTADRGHSIIKMTTIRRGDRPRLTYAVTCQCGTIRRSSATPAAAMYSHNRHVRSALDTLAAHLEGAATDSARAQARGRKAGHWDADRGARYAADSNPYLVQVQVGHITQSHPLAGAERLAQSWADGYVDGWESPAR